MNPVRPYRYPLQAPLPYLGANVMVTFNDRLNGFSERIGGAAPASGGGVGNWSLFTQQYDTTVKQWTIKQTGGDGAVFGIDTGDSHGQPHQQLLNWREPTKAVTVMYAMNYVNGGGDGAANAVFAKQASNGSKIAWGFNVNATTGLMTFQIWDGTTQQATSTITPTASTWQVYVGRWQANAQFDITPWSIAGVKGTTVTGVNFNGKIAHDNSVGSFCYFTQHTAAWGGCWPRYMTNGEVSAVIHAAQSQGNSFWRPPSLLFPTFAVVVHGIDVAGAKFGFEAPSLPLVSNLVVTGAEFGFEAPSLPLVSNLVVTGAEFGFEAPSLPLVSNLVVTGAEFGFEAPSLPLVSNLVVTAAEFWFEATSVALATTYYVATTGNDSTGTGAIGSPYATIAKAATRVAAGDTISVAAGNYQGSIWLNAVTATTNTVHGTSVAPITLVSTTQYGAKIKALSATGAGSGNNAALEPRVNWWIIDGFEIDGSGGYTGAGTTWTIGGTEWYQGIYVTGQNVTVQNCKVHDIARSASADTTGGSGIPIDTFYGGGPNCTISGNHVYNIGNGTGGWGLGNHVQGIYNASSNTHIFNNLVHNISSDGIEQWHAADAAVVYNNTVFQCNNGILIGTGDGGALAIHNCRVFNNICYDNKQGITEFAGAGGSIGSGNLFAYNMAYGNATNNWNLSVDTHTNDIAGPPNFVNYVASGGGDYSLGVGSNGINSGVSTLGGFAAPATDFNGTARPLGSGYDLGAFEFNPSNLVVTGAEFGTEVASIALVSNLVVTGAEFGTEVTSSALTFSTNLGVVSAEFGTEVTSTSFIRVSSVGAVSAEFGAEVTAVALSTVSDLAVQSAEFGFDLATGDPWSTEFSLEFGPFFEPSVTVTFDMTVFGPEFGFDISLTGTVQFPRVFDDTQQPFDTGYRSLRVVPIKPHRDKTALLKAHPSLFLYLNPPLDRVVQVEPTTRVVSVIGTPLSSIVGATVPVRVPQTVFDLRDISTPEFGFETDGVVDISVEKNIVVVHAEFGFETVSATLIENDVRSTNAEFGFLIIPPTTTKQSALVVTGAEFIFEASSAAIVQNDVHSVNAEFAFEAGSPILSLVHTISVDTPKFIFDATSVAVVNKRSVNVTNAKFIFEAGQPTIVIRLFTADVDTAEFIFQAGSPTLLQTHNVTTVHFKGGWETFGALDISQNATVIPANANLFLTTIMTASPWGLSGTTIVRDATDTADNRWRFDLTVGTGRSWIFNSQALTPGTVYTISGEVAGTVPFDVYSYDGGAFPYGNTLTKHIIPNNGTTTSTAIPTSQVLDFMGINTHIDFVNYPSTTTFSNSINYLGFKHLRDSPNKDTDVGVSGAWQTVANATGAKFCSFLNQGSVSSMQACLPRTMSLATQGIIEFVEGGNEEDGAFAVNAGNSMTAARDFQPTVFASAHAALLPCVNMSLGAGFSASNSFHGDYDKVGDLSNVCDYANAHTYQNPGGQTAEFSMQFLDTLAHLAAPSRQVMTTEVGWNLINGFTQAQQQRYALFSLFDAIKNRDARVYFYAIFDDTPVNGGSFGLMNSDGTPRPAATTLHNLNAILADTGTARPNRTLAYTLSGNTSNDHVVLMQKSTGTFQLAMWNEVDAAHNVTITLPGTATTVNVYDPQTGTTATSTSSNVSSKTVSIPDHVIIVEVVGLAGTIASQTFSFSFTKQATVAGGNPSVGIVYNYTGTQDFGTNTFSKMKLETGSQATVYVDPVLVPKNVSTTFGKGASVTLAMSNFKISGDIVNGIVPSGMPDLTFTVDVPNQMITVGTVSSTFSGTESGTFKLTDSFGNTSVQANFTVTVTVTAPVGGVLASHIIQVYYFGFGGPSVAQIMANSPHFNHLTHVNFQSQTNDGRFVIGNASTTDMAAWLASGRTATVLIGSNPNGGEGNGTLQNTTEGDQLITSLTNVINTYGFQGYDWDIEATSLINVSTCEYVDDHMKTNFPNLLRLNAPRYYELYSTDTLKRPIAKHTLYDWTAPQYYYIKSVLDPNGLGGHIKTDLDFYISDGTCTENRFVISFDPAQSDDGTGTNTSQVMPDSDATTIINDVRKSYPNIRGVSVWSSNSDTNITSWSNAMAANVAIFHQTFTVQIGGLCTTTNHGYVHTTGAYRASTSGTLPGGLSATQDYCIIVVDANNFRLATNKANAVAGTFVNITSVGNGTHTLTV